MFETRHSLIKISVLTLVLATVSSAIAQPPPELDNMRVVEPSGEIPIAFTTIQEAIDDIGATTEQYTVWVYPGIYEEAVLLNDFDENINIVGVDTDSVIIRPAAGSAGVTVEGVGARNNAIRNVTIEVVAGTGPANPAEGVLLKLPAAASGTVSNVSIENVAIVVTGTDSIGIKAEDEVSDLAVVACVITSEDDGVHFVEDVDDSTVADCQITTSVSGGNCVFFDEPVSNVGILGCTFVATAADSWCVQAVDPMDNITISTSSFRTDADDSPCVDVSGAFDESSIADCDFETKGETSPCIDLSGSVDALNVRRCQFTTREEDRSNCIAISGGTTQDPSTDIEIVGCQFLVDHNKTSVPGSDAIRFDDESQRVLIQDCAIQINGNGASINLDACEIARIDSVTIRGTTMGSAALEINDSTNARITNMDFLSSDANPIVTGTKYLHRQQFNRGG